MKVLTQVGLLVAVCAGLRGQEVEAGRPVPHVQSAMPETARYEVVQSYLNRRITIKLDRHMGWVWQLIKVPDGDPKWRRIDTPGASHATTSTAPRYRVFTSGVDPEQTLLIDTANGTTWVLKEDGDTVVFVAMTTE